MNFEVYNQRTHRIGRIVCLIGLILFLGSPFLMGLALGVLVGFINGTIHAKMNIAPFIVTMATQQICRGLATAGIIGNLTKTNASISGAECGCQAEIGTACSMAAAALAEIYTAADVFVNLSVEETFGMTTLEAVSCGTPAIVYRGTACEEVAQRFGGTAVEPNPRAIAGILSEIEKSYN